MRIFLVFIMSIFLQKAAPMCYEPEYVSYDYYNEKYGTAPIIVVIGQVLHTQVNGSHQTVRLKVSCVYQAPQDRMETLLHEEIRFKMQWMRTCKPKLSKNKSYFFFFEEKHIFSLKKTRRKKKKKNSGTNYTRISVGHPIPVEEMSEVQLVNLVSKVGQKEPIGHCYNVWSKWSACSQNCGQGTMDRVYPRLHKDSLNQTAVCLNAACVSKNSSEPAETVSQPFSACDDKCRSMELISVIQCNNICPDPSYIRTAVTWQLYPALMLCEYHGSAEPERLEYHNVATPTKCACLAPDSPKQRYSKIENHKVTNPDTHMHSWHRRNLKSTAIRRPI